MPRWIPIFALPMILGGCVSDSSVVYRAPAHFYYPDHSPSHYANWSLYSNSPHWRGYEIGSLPAKNIHELSDEEMRRTVDTVNLINLYNFDLNRNRFRWDRRHIRVTPGD